MSEDAGDASRRGYGYTCSLCRAADTFDEETLFYNTPVDVLRRALYRQFAELRTFRARDGDADKLMATLGHHVTCTRRIRHRSPECGVTDPTQCLTDSHWKLCSGYLKITLLVRFTLAVKPAVTTESLKCIQGVRLVDIVPNVGEEESRESVIRSLMARDEASMRTSAFVRADADDPVLPLTLHQLEDIWLRLCDVIFRTDVALWKLASFAYVTDAADRLAVTTRGEIRAGASRRAALVGLSRRSSLALGRGGVPLSCTVVGGRLPVRADTSLASERLAISCARLLDTLGPEGEGLNMYFNCYHVCKGRFGIEEYHISVALVPESAEEDNAACRSQMLSIHPKQNPILQVDRGLSVVKVIESLQRADRRFWVDVYVLGSLSLAVYADSKWASLPIN